ncbi:hypothetical protein ACP4OV_011416 [Aristida adscensionis]
MAMGDAAAEMPAANKLCGVQEQVDTNKPLPPPGAEKMQPLQDEEEGGTAGRLWRRLQSPQPQVRQLLGAAFIVALDFFWSTQIDGRQGSEYLVFFHLIALLALALV